MKQTTSKQGIHYLLGQVFLAREKLFFLKNIFRIFYFFMLFFSSSLFGHASLDNPPHCSKDAGVKMI